MTSVIAFRSLNFSARACALSSDMWLIPKNWLSPKIIRSSKFPLLFFEETFEKHLFRHSGLDPESRKCLITLDTGFRRYDRGTGLIGFFKDLYIAPKSSKVPFPTGMNADKLNRCKKFFPISFSPLHLKGHTDFSGCHRTSPSVLFAPPP